MKTLTVRPYQPSDCEAVHRIAADTAFFGAPIERYLDDRRLFTDYFYAYYTDYEPEHSWVAVDSETGKVAGFLTGCVDTQRKEEVQRRQVTPAVLRRLLRGHYRLGIKTFRYLNRLFWSDRRREWPEVDLSSHPAHLHINLCEAYRGMGAGRMLMQCYLSQLRELGVPGVHLGTTDQNKAACRLYEKTGFQLLGERPTRVWEGIIAEPVRYRVYGMILVG
ncbi:MAG TPA: GNAT family N-acetyltransferase [Anaerolineaceae bacterium]|nr:GNAT family N-acetyltransferase [Anaerolineaceae bacterium]